MVDAADHGRLSDSERTRLGLVADALIAGGSGMPSARQASVEGVWIDRILAARPDLLASLRLVATLSDDPESLLARLKAEDPETLDRLRYAVAAAYLINPRIRALLGYPSGAPNKQPAYPDESDAYLADGILDPVIDRGPIFRPTPEYCSSDPE